MIEPPYYIIDICGLDGSVVERIDNPISLVAARGFNTKGTATIELPREWDSGLFKWNAQLKIWRVARNYRHNLFGDTVWFLKRFRNMVSQDMYILELEDAFSILDNYLVAYTSQTPYADKTLEEFALVNYTDYFRIDNLMKQYVRENGGASSLDWRRINPLIEVEMNQNLASHAEKQAAWTQLSAVLSDLASTSEAEGLPIFYDLIPRADGSFLFRTWTDVRGVDRGMASPDPLMLAEDNGELDEVEISDDFSNIATLCYVLGYDSGPSQVFINMESARVDENPFSRVEFTANAPDVDVESVLINEGESALHGRRPRRTISARISPLAALDYDINFSYGWRVAVQADGLTFDCHVSAVTATWREGYEDLDIRLDGSQSLWEDVYQIPNTEAEPVDPDPPNDPPVVNAGTDQSVMLADTVNLDGTVTDDGRPNPPATVTTAWTMTSGPGIATFADDTAVDTTVTFDVEGDYVLRLTADDSALTAYDEVTISVGGAWTPPLPGDGSIFYGDIAAYLVWDTDKIGRTSNLQAAPPVWEDISGTVSGVIYDVQYMIVDASTVGVWAMTDTDIFFCADILAVTPTWTSVLTIATVRATAVAPTSGNVIFGSMQHFWSAPGHLCVAMSLDTENDNYLHCYYWVTEDYGANWTAVDHTADTFGTAPNERCYYSVGRYGLASHRSEPILYCGRSNGRTGTSSGNTAVFRSDDMGYTWTLAHSFGFWNPGNSNPAILNPFPDSTDPTYLVRAGGGGTSGGDKRIYLSTDGWTNATLLTEPAGHEGGFSVNGAGAQRPNKHTLDNTHVMNLFQADSSSAADLYESYDQGANWTLLKNLNNNAITPNGWPPDVNEWVLIYATNTPHIQLTTDNFANMLDKDGNILTVFGSWSNTAPGLPGGFALPRMGSNA